jgi:hypothetical protein
MKRDDIDYCESCGERRATQKDPEDPNAYCDACVAKITDQDYGVAFYAIRVMTDAMGSLHAQLRDDAETRRVVDGVLGDVLSGEYEGNHNIDVAAFKMTSRFQPLEAVTA